MRRVAPSVVGFGLTATALAAGACALATRQQPPLVVINESPSVPRGLYLRHPESPPTVGRLVTVEPPVSARPYLASLGVPAGMRLLKRVSGVGGQRVCARGHRLETPRGTVAVLVRDRRGTPLPAWRGCRSLTKDEVLLLGDTATSFDSRYFGPVRRTDVEASYRAVLTW